MRPWRGALLSLLVPAAVGAMTYHVPADYSTIQDGLDASGVGDTVLVAPGTYSDYTLTPSGISAEVAHMPDGVVLRSESGPAVTVIDLAPLDGAASSYAAFGCSSHASGLTVIEGFRVIGFPTSGYCVGVSIGYSAHIEVCNCVFEVAEPPNPNLDRGGIATRHTELHVVDCSFIRCSGGAGAGIGQVGGAVTVEGCTFIECANQGIRAIEGTGAATNSLTVRDCLFQGCTSDVGGAGIGAQDLVDGVMIDACRFEDLSMTGSGSVVLGGEMTTTVSNCVFRDIELLTGGGGCVTVLHGICNVVGNTMSYLYQPYSTGAAVWMLNYDQATFENNIIAHTSGTTAVAFRSGGPVTGGCNVFWDNVDGIGYTLRPTDRIADPQFCDEENGDLTLHESSPCLPANSLGCDLIGALGQGCGAVSVDAQSWGRTKSAYRSEEE